MNQIPRFRTGLYWGLTILGCLVFLELVARGIRTDKPGEPYGVTFTTSRGEPVSTRPGQLKLSMSPYTIYKPLPNQHTDRFTTDGHGFRGPFVNLEERRSLRVIVLGGSAVFGHGAADDSETFVGVLAAQHPDWQVINAGVSGFVSGQELAYLIHDLVDLQPDVVAVYDGWNDLFIPWYSVDAMGGEVESTALREIETQLILNHRTQTRVTSSLGRFLATLGARSALWETALEWMIALQGGVKTPITHTPRQEDEVFLERLTTRYIENLDKMGEICHSRGIRFLVAMQLDLGLRPSPSSDEKVFLDKKNRYEQYREEFTPRYRRFIERVRSSPQLANETVFDMNTEPLILSASGTVLLDWVHLSKEGNRLVAGVLEKKIAALK